ncbi:MAG TPA: hypothetical protein ENK88_04830 [Campylobacterales bacterium]|nr:hypothetical protein [Campylobacterales bacterium]HHC11302.1 hypothetical protein [Campylobacterales bacterium]
MAKKKNLDNLDVVIQSADLIENKKKSGNNSEEVKRKTINIRKDWEKKIKAYHGSTISSYIHIAIQEKMKRDGIL